MLGPLEYFVNYTILFGLFSRHIEVAIEIFGYFFDRLASVLGYSLGKELFEPKDFFGTDFNVGSLPPGFAEWLVEMDN